MPVKNNTAEIFPELLGQATSPVRIIQHLQASRGLQGALSNNTSTDLETVIGELLGDDVVAVAISNLSLSAIRIQFDGSDADASSAGIPPGATLPVYGVKSVLEDVRVHGSGGQLNVSVIQYVNL